MAGHKNKTVTATTMTTTSTTSTTTTSTAMTSGVCTEQYHKGPLRGPLFYLIIHKKVMKEEWVVKIFGHRVSRADWNGTCKEAFRCQYGSDHVVGSDIKTTGIEKLGDGPFEILDVRESDNLLYVLWRNIILIRFFIWRVFFGCWRSKASACLAN